MIFVAVVCMNIVLFLVECMMIIIVAGYVVMEHGNKKSMKRTLQEEIESIKKKMDIKSKKQNEYGCAMLYFNFPDMEEIHHRIDKKDIYIDPNDDSYGLEDEPHVTLLFGLHKEVTLSDVQNAVKDITFENCILHNISIFENPKYDVLKFDIKNNPSLNDANRNLKKFPFTTEYPDYHPHMTIGYLKPGKGKKYVQRLKDGEYKMVPEYGVYSEIDGTKTKFKIKLI